MALGYAIESFRAGFLVNPEIKSLILNLLMLQDISSLKPNVIVDPYMHNNPLWSLSYEWWFYMAFFPIVLTLKNAKHQAALVYSLSILSSLAYSIYPEFIPRLFMYISIWWAGVCLSNKYISGSEMNYRDLKIPLISLSLISLILGVQAYLFILSGKSSSVGVHPFLEFRHHIFALLVVVFAIAWKKINWFGFEKIFSPFLFLAPISYVIYISHYYLVVDASYLSFVNNKIIEWLGYIICLLVFSWTIEAIFYPKIQRSILNITCASSGRAKGARR